MKNTKKKKKKQKKTHQHNNTNANNKGNTETNTNNGKPKKYVTKKQCDQMARLFFNLRIFTAKQNLPSSIKITNVGRKVCQIPNKPYKKWPKDS